MRFSKWKNPVKIRKLLLFLLLLIVLAACIWYLYKPESVDEKDFTEQGQTTVKAGKLSFKVWDNEAEDGDTIAIYFRGKLIKNKLAIRNKPDTFQLGTLGTGEYLIGVKAISEGSSSPATATISITNGNEEKEFEMNAIIDSAAAWRIIIQ